MLRSKPQRWIPELRFGYPPLRNFPKSFWEKLGIFLESLGGSQRQLWIKTRLFVILAPGKRKTGHTSTCSQPQGVLSPEKAMPNLGKNGLPVAKEFAFCHSRAVETYVPGGSRIRPNGQAESSKKWEIPAGTGIQNLLFKRMFKSFVL